MGVTYGGTDLDTTWGFKIAANGLDLSPTTTRKIFQVIPGVDGARFFNFELEPRTIVIRGIVRGTSQSDLMAKIIGLDAAVDLRSFAAATNTTTYASIQKTNKVLSVPSFGALSFEWCTCDSMKTNFKQPRIFRFDAEVILTFTQWRPFSP